MDDTKQERRLPLDSIQKALTLNQNLQEQIRSEIDKIRGLKAKNRKRAAALSLNLPTSSTTAASTTTHPLPTCAWKNEYFAESKTKSVPEPNEDAIRREKAEEESFFARTNPSWQKKENERLLNMVAEISNSNENGSEEDAAGTKNSAALPESIDFTKVAANLSTKAVRRTAEQCRIQYRNLQHRNNKKDWTADEIESLRKGIEEQQKKQKGKDGNNSDPPTAIDWKEAAEKLGTNRTPWELLQAYFGKIVGKPKPIVWTPEEDEILLKYTAAMGPQVLIDGDFINHLSTCFLPDKTPKQIFLRINHSLANPNMKHEAWAEEDERKLALCMKVYSESSTPGQLSSGHLPWRSPMIVVAKWDRSMNPAFSVDPFSKKEDQELLKVMRQNPKMGFKEVATKFFPRRHPQRLLSRWSELATDKDILDRCGDQLVKDSQGTGEANEGEVDASELFVRLKKARRL